MHLGISSVPSRLRERTNTLYSTAENEDRHALSDGADETTEFEEEDSAEKDLLRFDDGEELTNEEDETALGYC